jgi:hypothetical protein
MVTKNTAKALKTSTANVKKSANTDKAGANINKLMADALVEQTKLARESEAAATKLLDAAIAFAKSVKAGVAAVSYVKAKKGEDAPADDTAQFVAAYSEGLRQPLSEGSANVRISQYRAFAHPATIEKLGEIRTALETFMAGKTKAQCNDKDLFSAMVAVCVAIKNAAIKNAPVPTISAAIKAACTKPVAVAATPAPAKEASPEDVLKAQKEEFATMVELLAGLPAKSLPKGAKAYLKALAALDWE